MIKHLLVAPLFVLLGLSACAQMDGFEQSGAASAGSGLQAESEQAISVAEQAFQEINKRGGAWAYTEETLDAAKEAVKSKDYDKALKLAKEAHDQAMMATKQFESQTGAGPYLF